MSASSVHCRNSKSNSLRTWRCLRPGDSCLPVHSFVVMSSSARHVAICFRDPSGVSRSPARPLRLAPVSLQTDKAIWRITSGGCGPEFLLEAIGQFVFAQDLSNSEERLKEGITPSQGIRDQKKKKNHSIDLCNLQMSTICDNLKSCVYFMSVIFLCTLSVLFFTFLKWVFGTQDYYFLLMSWNGLFLLQTHGLELLQW